MPTTPEDLNQLQQLRDETEALMRASQILRRYSFAADRNARRDIKLVEDVIQRHRDQYQNLVRNTSWKRLEGFEGFWINQNGLIESRYGTDLMAMPEDRLLETSQYLGDPWLDYNIWYRGERWAIRVLTQRDDDGWFKVVTG